MRKIIDGNLFLRHENDINSDRILIFQNNVLLKLIRKNVKIDFLMVPTFFTIQIFLPITHNFKLDKTMQ